MAWQRGHLPPLPVLVHFPEYYRGLPLLPIPDIQQHVIGIHDNVDAQRLQSLISNTAYLLTRLRDIQQFWITTRQIEGGHLSYQDHQEFINWCVQRNINPPAALPPQPIQPLYVDLLAPEVISLLTDSDTESEAEEVPMLVEEIEEA